MAKVPTGDKIVLKVGALADPATRAVPGVLNNVVGTSAGYRLGEQELSSREFGSAASLWEDGAVVSKSWSVPVQMNYRPDETANGVLEDKARTTEEVYVEFYPFGEVSGQPYFSGYATINGWQVSAPRDGIMTASCTLQGRGALTKSTVV